MIYKKKELLIDELKKTVKKSGSTLVEVSRKLNILPQKITEIFNKKHFSFDNCSDILGTIGKKLYIEFIDDKKNEEPVKLDESTKKFLNIYNQLNDLQKAEIRGIVKGMLK